MEVLEISFLRNGVIEPEVFAVEQKNFLEKMRHSSSYDLVRKIKTFITTFAAMEGRPEDFSSYLQNFLEEISLILEDHPLWREEDENGLTIAMEALERYLLTRLYSTAFYLPTSTDCEDDEKFYHRSRILQFLQPDHLDLPNRKYNQIAFEMAAQELNRLEEDLLKAPREKLACVINAVTIVTNLLKHSQSYQGTSADDILPYLIFLLLLTSPKHIHSNLRYIRRFRRPSLLTSEEAYYLTQVESAVMFISNVDQSSLSISEEEFVRGVKEAEEKIKSGLDIPRRFSHDRGWERLLVDLSATNLTFDEKNIGSAPTPPAAHDVPLSSEETVEEEIVGGLGKKIEGPQLPSLNDAIGFPQGEDEDEKEEEEEKIVAGGQKDVQYISLIKDCILPKILQTRFEELTVCDLKQLHSCYKTMVKRLEDLQDAIS